MDKTFFFVINAEPTKAAGVDDIKEALATICVMASSLEEAKTKATAYLMDYGWIGKKVETSFRCDTPEQIARLQIPEKSLLRKAQRDGIAALFEAWRKNILPDCDIEIRSMRPPVISGKKH